MITSRGVRKGSDRRQSKPRPPLVADPGGVLTEISPGLFSLRMAVDNRPVALPALPRDPRLPIVSVVTPLWNGAKHIRETYDHLASQTLSNWEWICVDNGSADGSAEIVEGFRDRRVTLLRLGRNMHISFASNLGLLRARGEYVFFLDQDDPVYPTCFEQLAARLDEAPWLSAVYANMHYLNDNGSVKGQSDVYDFDRLKLLHLFFIMHPILYRRSSLLRIGGLQPLSDLAQDAEVTHRLSDKESFERVPGILYGWRLGPNSTSVTHGKAQAALVKASAKATVWRRIQNPRVCFVLPTLAVNGGIKVVVALCNGLQARGWDVYIVSLSGLLETPDLDIQVPVYGEVTQATDLVIATETGTCDATLGFRHGFHAWFCQGWEGKGCDGWVDEGRFLAQFKRFRNIVCVSRRITPMIPSLGGPEATCIPPGIPLDVFKPDRRPRPGEPPTIGFLYTHGATNKQWKLHVEVAQALKKRHPKWRFVAFGQGQAPTLEGVTYYRLPPQEQLPSIYSQMDLFFQMNLDLGESLPPKEAMAVGVPVVVQSNGPENYMTNGKHGVLLDPTDAKEYIRAIERLLNDRARYRRFRAAGRKLAREEFGIPTMRDAWEAWLRDTITEEYIEWISKPR